MNRFRLMLIGCGRISKNHIAAAAANNELCELSALCDPVVENAEKQAERYRELTGSRPPVFAGYREALACTRRLRAHVLPRAGMSWWKSRLP